MEKEKQQEKANGFHFQWNDLRAFITVINVILIMIYGLSISWFGLAVAVLGIIKNLAMREKNINTYIMYIANISLNIYFLILLYC